MTMITNDRSARAPRGARALLLAALLAGGFGCASPTSRLGTDPLTEYAEARSAAFEELERTTSIGDPIVRSAAERDLFRLMEQLTLRVPADVEVRVASAALALRLGDNDRARRELDRALTDQPGHLPAAVLQCRVLCLEGELLGAREVIETAQMLNPDEPELFLALAQVETLEGRFQEAQDLLRTALELGAEPERVEFDLQVLDERRDAAR